MTLSKEIQKIELQIAKLEAKQYYHKENVNAQRAYQEALIQKQIDCNKALDRYEKLYIQVTNQIQDKVRQMKELVLNYSK